MCTAAPTCKPWSCQTNYFFIFSFFRLLGVPVVARYLAEITIHSQPKKQHVHSPTQQTMRSFCLWAIIIWNNLLYASSMLRTKSVAPLAQPPAIIHGTHLISITCTQPTEWERRKVFQLSCLQYQLSALESTSASRELETCTFGQGVAERDKCILEA